MKNKVILACLALLIPAAIAAPATAETLEKVTAVIPDNSVFVLNWKRMPAFSANTVST